MIAIFSRKSTASYVLLFIYALILKSPDISNNRIPLKNNSDGIFYEMLLEKLSTFTNYDQLLSAILAFVLIFIQAIQLSRIINRDKLMSKNNQLAAMSYLLITSLYPNWNIFSSALVANTFILAVWSQISKLQHSPGTNNILFTIGLYIGLSNFFFTFSFPFIILAFIGLLTYRPFRLKEYLVIVVGFLLPYYCLFFYQYMKESFSLSNYKLLVDLHPPKFTNPNWAMVSILIIGLLILIGFYTVQTQSNKMNIQARKSWSILFFYFVTALFVPFLCADFSYWVICLIPAAALIGAGFLYMPNQRLKSGLHWAIFAFAVYIGYFL